MSIEDEICKLIEEIREDEEEVRDLEERASMNSGSYANTLLVRADRIINAIERKTDLVSMLKRRTF